MDPRAGNVENKAFLERYRQLMPIRARESFHLVSAETDDGPAVLVLASPRADRTLAREKLELLASAHASIEHPAIPRTRRADTVGDEFVVELACDGIADGEDVLRARSDLDSRVPYPVADGVITYMREALQAGHAASHHLGRICYANMLYSAAGRVSLIGFGYNVLTLRETGTVVGSSTVFQAPEVAAGGAPSPVGDYVALLLLMRSLTTHVELVEGLIRVMRGVVEARDFEILKHLRWFEKHIFAAMPQERPTLDEATAVAARLRELLGVKLVAEEREAYFRDLIARAGLNSTGDPPEEAVPESQTSPSLDVASDGSWFRLEGQKRELGPRRPLRRVFAALIEQRLRKPGTALSVWEVLAAGWPGEEPMYEAALNRVYVTMTRLRGLGLANVIERFDEGYRIGPDVTVRVR